MTTKTKKYYIGKIKNDSQKLGHKGWVVGKFMENLPQKTDLVEIKYWELPPGTTKHQTKISDTFETTIIVKGKVSGTLNRKKITLSSGDYCVIPPGIPNNLCERILKKAIGITIKAPSDPNAKHVIEK